MNPRSLLLSGLAIATASIAHAQHGHGSHPPGAGAPGQPAHGQHAHGPYAGMQGRAIKALSDQQVADLRAGNGMSLALPAELNGYPGPAHALELADQLKLSAEQKERTQHLHAQMQREAQATGEEVISAEAALDALFKERKATPQGLSVAAAKAALAHGRLRETHLRYHLAMMEVLSADQVAAYNRLRGY
jgi:hypothetical protein